MKRSTHRYSERRERLVRQAAQQRHELVRALRPWARAAGSIDSGIANLRASPYPPSAIVAVAAALLVLRPQMVLRWTRRLWFGLNMYQTLRMQKRER
jgi:YqjK-like protein